VLRTIEKPWTEVTFHELCDMLRCLNHSTKNIAQPAILLESSRKFSQQPHPNKLEAKEVENNGFMKQFCLFLLLLLIIVILFWLIFSLFK
jgi:hypothetical protein